MPTLDALLVVDDVAEHLRCSTEHVRRLIRRGELPARKLGRTWLVDPADLRRFVASLPASWRPTMAGSRP